LIEGFARMMKQDESIGPMNIGNPSEFTILELAEKVIKLTGSQSKIIHETLPSDDPKQRQPDITQARQVLDWEPKYSLDEGLKPTIAYFDQLLAMGESH
jgi:UDP-glucuronate decarboxylase